MQREHNYYVYILASQPQGMLYIGVTNDLRRRVEEHRNGEGETFTKRYGLKMLVWHEHYGDVLAAIQREKSLKRWPRDWKKNLIERENPHWQDLYPTLIDGA
jgi:putative endonuclease